MFIILLEEEEAQKEQNVEETTTEPVDGMDPSIRGDEEEVMSEEILVGQHILFIYINTHYKQMPSYRTIIINEE